MPYIDAERRHWLEPRPIDEAVTAGELNFQVACLVNEYLTVNGVSYHRLNDVVGVLECLKLEIYRRLVAPYEDDKIIDNGDVFTISPTDRS